MATRRRVARCWKSQVSAKAPRPSRRMARWVGEEEEEIEPERLKDRGSDDDDDAIAAAADVESGFFFFFSARPRSSSSVLGGRVQRFPMVSLSSR